MYGEAINSITAQRLLYNQCNADLVGQEIDRVLFVVSAQAPQTPLGTLTLNDYSQLLECAMGCALIDELQQQQRQADFVIAESYVQALLSYAQQHQITCYCVMRPAEPSLARFVDEQVRPQLAAQGIDLLLLANTQFLISHDVFAQRYETPPVMETFYRWMRRETGILMEQGQPIGGQWNYDKANRGFDRSFAGAPTRSPKPHSAWDAACAYYQIDKPMIYPVDRAAALDQLAFFVDYLLPRFGDLQDAMYREHAWVHHSLLSVALNFGLLTVHEVLDAVIAADVTINNKEGFVRQVLGWREYMYHYFLHYQETIYDANVLEHTKRLPQYFWWPEDSPLQMACVNDVLSKVKRDAYSHHIERLMIIGNFVLLCEIDPRDVTKWFWEMYADAFERVVVPNVMGMSQYADGGKLATKPYVSSANYINKMSNYCKGCFYDPKAKEGERVCPFNYLYWRFVDKHQDIFGRGRQSFIIKHLAKKNLTQIRQQSKDFLDRYMGETTTE